jgi:hypothetical protein
LISVLFTVDAFAGAENVIEMGEVVDTEVAPDAGEEDATENVPGGVEVTCAPLAQPVISATRKVREVRAKLEEFVLRCMASATFFQNSA